MSTLPEKISSAELVFEERVVSGDLGLKEVGNGIRRLGDPDVKYTLVDLETGGYQQRHTNPRGEYPSLVETM
jgi:quercetin dioxygenase-like cupin family protein